MPKITGLKVDEINILSKFKKGKTKISQNLDKFKKELGYDILDLLPKDSYYTISFIIKDTVSAFANAIRRILASEMPVWSLNIDQETFESDDEYIRFDDLAIKICSMPIEQTYLNKLTDKININNQQEHANNIVKFKINAKNKTPEPLNVYSKDIEVSDSSRGTNISDFAFDGIQLQNLASGRYIKIKLKLEKGYGYNHGAKFAAVPMPHYHPADHSPIEIKHKSKPTGISSTEINPKEFFISYTTYTDYKNPLDIIILCIDELIRRVSVIGMYISEYEKSLNKGRVEHITLLQDVPKELRDKIIIYKNEFIEIRKENHTYFFDIKNESLTISKLFSRYIYELHKGIALVTDAEHHPSQRSVFIKVQDENAIKLMIKAHDSILKDLESIRKDFSKK